MEVAEDLCNAPLISCMSMNKDEIRLCMIKIGLLSAAYLDNPDDDLFLTYLLSSLALDINESLGLKVNMEGIELN